MTTRGGGDVGERSGAPPFVEAEGTRRSGSEQPKSHWLSRPGRIETCLACNVSFEMRPGESTSSLIHRYTDWREAHVACRLPGEPAGPPGLSGDPTAPDERPPDFEHPSEGTERSHERASDP